MQHNKNLDQVILVDENDHQLGVMDKIEAHRHPAKLHRASSVLLHNSKGEWLIQQRSQHKIVAAHKWANTCCGNVRPGESYLECARRRLEVELGIKGVALAEVKKFTYQIKCNDEFGENEIDTVFVGQYDGEVVFNPAEVQHIKWISKEDLLADLKKDGQKYSAWTKLVLDCYAEVFSQD